MGAGNETVWPEKAQNVAPEQQGVYVPNIGKIAFLSKVRGRGINPVKVLLPAGSTQWAAKLFAACSLCSLLGMC